MSTETSSNFSVASAPYAVSAGHTAASAGPHGYASSAGTNEPVGDASLRSSDKRPPKPTKPMAADRIAVGEHFAEALSRAKALELAAAAHDPQEAAVAGLDLRHNLDSLWRLRRVRTSDWATIINKLQVVTSNVEFEEFTRDMAMAVRLVIESHLRPDVDNDDVRAATVLLERAGFQPWKSIASNDGN